MWLRTFHKIKSTAFAVVGVCTLPLYAQVENRDSLPIIELDEIVVDADLQRITASVSSYFPTSKQKNASPNGIDLLNRMAIP